MIEYVMKDLKCLLCFVFVPLWLQPLGAQEEKTGRKIVVRCLAFAKVKNDKDIYLHALPLAPETLGVKVRLKRYLNHERATIQLVGDRIVFSRSPEAEHAEEETVARVRIPSKLNKILLVFFPGKQKDKEAYRVLALDDSVGGFPRGAIQCFNLSGQPVLLKLEKKRYEIKSGDRRIILNPPVNEFNHSAMYAHTKKDDQWRRIGAGLWPHPGNKRVLQFFYVDPVSRRVKLKGIKDVSIR